MSVYRIAVCDDDPAMLAHLHELCHDILREADIDHEIADFHSATALEGALSTQVEPFALLILDIQMEGMTGMELARSLRARGDEVSIIFVTASTDYAMEGYEVRPIHYLLKPIARQALEKALRTDWTLHHAPRTVVLQAGGRPVSLPLADIRYVESSNHNTIVHLLRDAHSFLMPLTQAERLLPDTQFVRCHNSYLVNLAHVRLVGRKEVTLRGGDTLPVGRRYYEAIQKAFIQYMNH